MKIAYCIPSLAVSGGGQRVLAVKANYFVQHFGYEIHIIVTDGKDAKPFFALDPSIKIHQLDINYDNYDPLYRRFFVYIRKRMKHRRKLNKCLCNIKPDITVFMLRRELDFLSFLKDGSIKIAENHFDKKHYLEITNPHLSRFMPRFFLNYWKKSILRNLRKVDKFVLLTNEDLLSWTELDNMAVIPNPISFSVDSCLSTVSNRQVIAVGRYEWQKGFDLLITAWKMIVNKYPDWILKIYGDGPMRDTMKCMVDDLQLNKSCYLEYPVSNIAEKYAESSIFVLSSRFEGFGLVIVEAMSCGLPVVSFACPCGPRDIIKDNEDGFLVEPENLDGLVQKIQYLIAHESERKLMGEKAIKNVNRYRIEEIALLWKNLFESLIKDNNND